jgi:hypothetical protein
MAKKRVSELPVTHGNCKHYSRDADSESRGYCSVALPLWLISGKQSGFNVVGAAEDADVCETFEPKKSEELPDIKCVAHSDMRMAAVDQDASTFIGTLDKECVALHNLRTGQQTRANDVDEVRLLSMKESLLSLQYSDPGSYSWCREVVSTLLDVYVILKMR